MAQTRSESPRQTDPRAQAARPGDGVLTSQDLDGANDPAGAEPLDLAQQIDSLLNEIEQASAAADPWGDAAQRAADKVKDDEERTLEPSQKLLAKVREGEAVGTLGPGVPAESVAAAPGVGPEGLASIELPDESVAPMVAAVAISEIAGASEVVVAPEIVGVSEPDVLAEAFDAVLNESLAVAAEPVAGVEDTLAAESAEPSLAAELDAALKEAGDALEQIIPPEDPPVDVSVPEPVATGVEQIVEEPEAAPAPVAVAEPAVAAHWTNTGVPASPAPELVAAAAPPEAPALAEVAEAPVDADDLDAALAAQAEELEESSRAAQRPAPATAPVGVRPGGESEAQLQIGEQAALHSTASAAPAAAPAEAPHSTQHNTVTAAANMATTAAAHATQAGDSAPVVVPEAKPDQAPAVAKPSFVACLRAPLNRVGNVLAMPLAVLPESARDIVAYLAAVTVFNALAVWSYMLFIHTPVVPPPAHDAPALHSTEPAPKAHGDHGDSHAAGGHADAKHGVPHADEHAGQAKSGRGDNADVGHDAGRAPVHKPAEVAPAQGAGSHEPAPH